MLHFALVKRATADSLTRASLFPLLFSLRVYTCVMLLHVIFYRLSLHEVASCSGVLNGKKRRVIFDYACL